MQIYHKTPVQEASVPHAQQFLVSGVTCNSAKTFQTYAAALDLETGTIHQGLLIQVFYIWILSMAIAVSVENGKSKFKTHLSAELSVLPTAIRVFLAFCLCKNLRDF
uniref:Uncharacterized protein n=1 Tax=Pyxicephalus adspersus TaxID=30357 RepID=A0AAV3B3P3_PYXAD|nr:TPA: hypothetical protein GDO54_009607 [Pyxicephalus adspersus]